VGRLMIPHLFSELPLECKVKKQKHGSARKPYVCIRMTMIHFEDKGSNKQTSLFGSSFGPAIATHVLLG